MAAADCGGKQGGTVPILNIRFMNDGAYQKAARIGRDMPFAALHLLAASNPRGPPASVVFTGWLSITPAVGLPSRPAASRARMTRW